MVFPPINFVVSFSVIILSSLELFVGRMLRNVSFVAVVDITLHEAKFEGMKLSGLVMVASGFIIVLFPENWPNAIQHVVR
jgi:solute carrier family 35 protein F3/4